MLEVADRRVGPRSIKPVERTVIIASAREFALNIGYDLGILSPRIFAMLVLMALITTAMTGPLLTLAESLRTRQSLAIRPA